MEKKSESQICLSLLRLKIDDEGSCINVESNVAIYGRSQEEGGVIFFQVGRINTAGLGICYYGGTSR